MYTERFVRNLNKLCKGLTVSVVAKEIGISHRVLQRYLLNEQEIRLADLCKIADYFNITLDSLVGREEY